MPRRTDIESILIIGAGPIIIGQACEFDYSGAQACKALREEGYRVILVNSNPATIMTDPGMADATYIEPINWQTVEKIIEKEKPDALLPTMGGQTALNCALDLAKHGVLEKHGVEMIGADRDAIDKAEDRQLFKEAMTKIGLGSARSGIAHSMEEAVQVQAGIGFPVIIRPSFTMGGTGGGIAYNMEEFATICERGLEASPTRELLIEESLIGWKEYEMEVVRDKADNCIIVCSIENLDAIFFQHAVLGQVERAVQRGLAAHGRQQRIRPFLLDDLFHRLPVDRLDIGGIGHAGVGHDGGRVGVDQDHPVTLFLQCLAGLGA